MSVKSISKKVVINTEDTVDYQIKNGIVAVRLISISNKKEVNRDNFFITVESMKKSQRGKNPTISTFFNIPEDEKFKLCDPKKFKLVEKDFSEGVQFYKSLNDSMVEFDAIDYMNSKGYKKKNLIRFKSYDHTFYRIGEDIPISMPYHISYIGGVTNGDFNLALAEKILKKNKYVYNVEMEEIPYYNSEAGRDRTVEFSVQLPQKKFNEIYSILSGNDRLNMRDIFSSFYWYDDCPDVLGLGKALLSQEERDERSEM